ncbi:MAG TPA: cobalamin-binding protein [Steroidobacteraceae bacterium]|nr:cobalamin-binding protein [Steroidobacteraceae bacterium]
MAKQSIKVWMVLFGAMLCAVPAAQAHRIVSLAPHLTELAFAAGAGDQMVGTVLYSDHPAAARELPRIGDAFRVDLERLLALHPTLVLVWEGGTPQATIEQVRRLQLPVEVFSTRVLADVPRTIVRLGEVAQTHAVAAAAASQFTNQVAALRAQYASRPTVNVFLQVNNRPLYTVNGRQIMSEVLQVCGGKNIFDDLTQLAPIVSVEAVLARQPQAIISTDQQPPDIVTQWAQWKNLPAVHAGALYTLRADNLTQANARMPVGMRALCETLEDARRRLAQIGAS